MISLSSLRAALPIFWLASLHPLVTPVIAAQAADSLVGRVVDETERHLGGPEYRPVPLLPREILPGCARTKDREDCEDDSHEQAILKAKAAACSSRRRSGAAKNGA